MPAFAEYCERVEQHLQSVYGIRVITRDVPDPLTGDLDGAEIHIDYLLDAEQRLFLLAHLFGHTVQWNVDPRAYEIGMPKKPPVDPALLPALVEYEREAAGYALSMLHACRITDMDQWLSDYTASDMAYLEHFYRTGEKREFETFRVEGAPLLTARDVPPFTPVRLASRLDGIVI